MHSLVVRRVVWRIVREAEARSFPPQVNLLGDTVILTGVPAGDHMLQLRALAGASDERSLSQATLTEPPF